MCRRDLLSFYMYLAFHQLVFTWNGNLPVLTISWLLGLSHCHWYHNSWSWQWFLPPSQSSIIHYTYLGPSSLMLLVSTLVNLFWYSCSLQFLAVGSTVCDFVWSAVFNGFGSFHETLDHCLCVFHFFPFFLWIYLVETALCESTLLGLPSISLP